LTDPNDIPELIGPYRVLRPIARGGMAEVYEVEDPPTGEHFALKLLKEGGTARQRFDREYEAMTRLNHPNIVRVYNYGFHQSWPWMTMELLGGATVQAYVKRIGRPGTPERVAEVVRVAHDIARALDHIHRRGLIHRDLKSDNVLVLPDGRVKLLDFGAAHVQEALEQITREGEFLGTLAYASPEQFMGRGIDHRSDLYSLGVLLYRLATGRRPFWSRDHHTLAKMHVTQPPRPPRQLVSALPEALERVILWLLEKKAIRRPESGAQVAEALQDIAGEPLYLPGTLDVSAAAGALVGREDQVRQVRVFLDEGRPGGVALVLGMPGSGRQTVMDMVREEAEKRSWEVWDCWGRPGQGVLPFVEMIGGVVDTIQLSLPAIDAAREQIQTILARGLHTREEDREAFYRSCATVLRARVVARGQGVLVMVWNLHQMGSETVKMLRVVREEIARTKNPLVFVADADDAEGALLEQGVYGLTDATQVRLEPLEVGAVAVLVGALLHRRPPPTTLARRIYAASGGLPDFVNEVLASLVKQGILRVKGDDANRLDWAQREDLTIPVSTSARRALEETVGQLPAVCVRLLEALCLVGGETTVDVLAWALECTAEEVVPMIPILREGGFAVSYQDEEGDLWVRWRHELLGRIVLRQLHPCRRFVLRHRLIQILEDAPTFAAQIRIMLEEGRIDAAVKRALEWGTSHAEENRPETALQVLQPVVAAADAATGSAQGDLARLFLLHANCVLMTRPTDDQIQESLDRALTHLALADDPDLTARLQLVTAQQRRAAGHYADFRRYLAAAWKQVDKKGRPAFAAEIARLAGLSMQMSGKMREAGIWYRRGWELAQTSGDGTTMANAQVGLARYALADGSILEAEKMSDSSVRFFDEVADARGLSIALPVWVDALRLQGRFSEALAALRVHLPTLKAGEAPTFYVRLALANAWCEADLCRLGRAQESVEELVSTLRKGEHLHLRLEADLVAGRVLVDSGQGEEAVQVLPSIVERAEEAELVLIAEHARALWGEALAALGEHKAARARFQDALTRVQACGDMSTLAAICAARVRAMAEHDDPNELFDSLRDWMVQNKARALQVEFLIARARHRAATGQDAGPDWQEARECLEEVVGGLDDTDRAVFRVHPWSRAVRRGGA